MLRVNIIVKIAGHARSRPLVFLLACATLFQPGAMPAALVPVRYTEGLSHGDTDAAQ